MTLASGVRLGVYEIVDALGAGGMGEVYRARDTRLGRFVAIKVLRPDLARELGSRERFEAEARAVSRLNHPHICTLHDVGRERVGSSGDEIDFLVMELVEGEPLNGVLARGPFSPAQVVRYGLEIAAALTDAHERGVVHGDLKPANIMTTRFGVKLLDFGLARQRVGTSVSDLTRTPVPLARHETIAGTLPYMAPEVLRGSPSDASSDLWALGIVLHEMATGVRPFTGRTSYEVSARILESEPAAAPVWIPAGLQTVIHRCLVKNVEGRYRHAGEVKAALEAIQSDPAIVPPSPASAHNLPAQLTRFIGRERERADVRAAVGKERLVTLTGAGGAGKTRLALQVAQDLVQEFQHGVWLLELAPLADPHLLSYAVASTLGVRHDVKQDVTDTLIEFLRARSVLLLLDNCEHLIESCATLVDQILRTCPRVRVLATSREALAIAGERAWRVPSLVLPDMKSAISTDMAARSDAVRFFVDRAQAVAPQFMLTVDNAPALVRVCQRLDGIPLAIELAAARMKVLSLEQIDARLDDRFKLLTGGSRTAMPRQQTLRATIDWSYDLLSDEERRLLRGLAVFSGGCTLEAADAVCAGAPAAGETIDLLSHLVDKSLVAVEDDGVGTPRYRLLETVRQYARDRLFESGAASALRARHCQFFETLTLDAEPRLVGPDHALWSNRIAADHDNIRAALEWALATAEGSEAPLRMVCALWVFWTSRNYFNEGRQWVERALAAAPGAPRTLRLRALAAATDFAFLGGDYPAARAFGAQAISLDDAKVAEGRWAVAFVLFVLSIELIDRRELATAGPLAERSVAVARASGAAHIIALTLIAPMYLARISGDYDRALTLIEESLTLVQPGGQWMLGTVLYNICDVLLCQARLSPAQERGREGVVSSYETRNIRAMTWCLAALACVAAAQRRLRQAARLWGAAEGLSQAIGSPLPPFVRNLADTHLPDVRRALGDERFAAHWAEGRQMTPDAVVACALSDDD